MISFPLYENIEKDIINENTEDIILTNEEKKDLLKNIEKLDQNSSEILYVLIKIYGIQNDNIVNSQELPYKGKKLKKKLKFDLNNLPIKLIQIIRKFVYMNLVTKNI